MSIVPPCPAGTCRSSVTTDGRYGWALSPFPQIRLSLCQMSRRQIWCCEQIAIIFISFFFPSDLWMLSGLQRIPPGGSVSVRHPNQ